MQQPAPSTRWCPTPEQLMILEEMYRTGIRTPNAAQIRQITAHLSYYGKIEGKNVFYWFQNHKARDRQKMRRRLSCLQQQQNGQVLQAQAQAQAQTLLSHQIFHLELSPHPPSPSALLPHLHFPYHHHLRRHQPSSHFPHQTSSGYYNNQQEPENMIPPPVMNLVCKLEPAPELVYEAPPTNTIGCVNVPYCRPLKTLDLFPTRAENTGSLKDIDRTISSKSSSCSTSTTN